MLHSGRWNSLYRVSCVLSTEDPVKARTTSFLGLSRSPGQAFGFGPRLSACSWKGTFLFLHPFVIWTFRIYLGVFTAPLAWWWSPLAYMAKEIYEAVADLRVSKLERRLSQIWSGCAGFFFSLLLGGAAASICFGPLRDVKLWFIGVCWALLMIPWWLAGYLGRKFVRRFSPARRVRERGDRSHIARVIMELIPFLFPK